MKVRIAGKLLFVSLTLPAQPEKWPKTTGTIFLAFFSFCAILGFIEICISSAADPLPPFSF
jgi:hypothetical protein